MAISLHKNKKSAKKSRRIIAIALIGVLVIGAGAAAAWWYYGHHPKNTVAVTSNDTPGPTINYNPPTNEELQSAQQQKEDLIKKQEQATTPPPASTPPETTTNNVTPIITYAGMADASNVSVSAYVPDIVEEGGTCTMTATKGSQTVTKQVAAGRNAQYTNCPTFYIAKTEFTGGGTWSVKVAYSSSKHNGSSPAQNMEVK